MITKRILTMKSKVGIGRHANDTIEQVLAADCSTWVRWAYYNLDVIDFTQDVKKRAMIFIDIPKPGVDKDAGKRNERLVWAKQKESLGEEKYMGMIQHKRKTERMNKENYRRQSRLDGLGKKSVLQAINHGKIKI